MKYNKIKQTGLCIACVLALAGCGSNSNTVAETQITLETVETATEPATEVAESVEARRGQRQVENGELDGVTFDEDGTVHIVVE